MELFNLGKVPWQTSQLIYHALAEQGREALSLVSPATPYVCIGFHQDPVQELDLDYCRENQIPVFRRDLGGGAVYLDGNQFFFHLILHRKNPLVTKSREVFYKKFLQPVINVYRRIGIPAEYKPINDVIANSRKVSGTGVGEIGHCVVFVGNLIYDFDYETMSRVLKVPDEKFRDKVHKTLQDNLSTICRELGDEAALDWTESKLNALMVEEFSMLVGSMEPAEVDSSLQAKMDEMGQTLMSDEWFFRRGKKLGPGRAVKIKAGMDVVHKMYKAQGGLIRADITMNEGRMEQVTLTGDFYCFPEEAMDRLETTLEGQEIKDAETIIRRFYEENDIETPGINLDDWMQVLSS
jgi:lipoate-protein ligase A